MSPKEKALANCIPLDNQTVYYHIVTDNDPEYYDIEKINEALDIALKTQAEEIIKDIEDNDMSGNPSEIVYSKGEFIRLKKKFGVDEK